MINSTHIRSIPASYIINMFIVFINIVLLHVLYKNVFFFFHILKSIHILLRSCSLSLNTIIDVNTIRYLLGVLSLLINHTTIILMYKYRYTIHKHESDITSTYKYFSSQPISVKKFKERKKKIT